MAFTPFPTNLLVLYLGLLLCICFVYADNDSNSNTHVTCDSSIANSANFTWWNNKQNNNPCMVLQALLRQCDPTHTIHLMPASPLQPPDICQASALGSNGGETDFTPCCCNTAAYALRQACWSCQQGAENPRKPDRRPTFREYLQCPKSVNKKQFKDAKVPKWAFTPIDPDATWDFDTTRALVSMANSKNMMSMGSGNGGDDDDDDDSNNGNGGHHGKGKDKSNNNNGTTSQQTSPPIPENGMQGPTMAVAIAGGVLAGLAAVASVLAVVICIKRRRQRKQRAMMPTWYANGAYASPVRSSTVGIDLDGPPPVIVMPPPSLARGRAALTPMTAASWSSSLAREPLIPRASSTLEPDEMMYANARAPVVSMSKTHSFSI